MTAPRHAWSLLAVAAALAGCVASAPSLELGQVEPAGGWSGESVEVTITGQGFFPAIVADASSKTAQVDQRYTLSLRQGEQLVTTLENPRLLSSMAMTAIVPEGVEPGRYDLWVRDPRGAEAVLPQAYTVRATQAHRLVLDPQSSDPFWLVEDTAVIDAFALDADDHPISSPLAVRLTLDPLEQGVVLAGFPDGVLLDQTAERRGSGAAIIGRLHADGTARVPVTVSSPASVLLRLEALEHGVAPANLRMDWYDSADYRVSVALEPELAKVDAGTSFIAVVTVHDAVGTVVEEPVFPIHATLRDACQELDLSLRDLKGATHVPLLLRKATGETGCASEQRISVEHRGDTLTSSGFQVDPGPVQRFAVELPSSEIPAGAPFTVRARPVDTYGNLTTWSGPPARITVHDTIGDISTQSCATIGRELHCPVVARVADRGVVLLVRDPVDGLTGTSLPYNVRPGPISGIEVDTVTESDVVAGVEFNVQLAPVDSFGNRIPPELFAPTEFVITDLERSEAHCAPISDSDLTQKCALFTATSEATLVATGPVGAAGSADPLTVLNAELDTVELHAQRTSVVAGQSFELRIIGHDAFGNRYQVQRDPELALSDHSGTLSPAGATLSESGEVSILIRLNQAGSTQVVASQGGAALGESELIEVAPAEASTLALSTSPWWWVGETAWVEIHALDSFGNKAPLNAAVELGSTEGAFEAAMSEIIEGVARVGIEPTAPAVPDRLIAHTAEIEGSLDGQLVVARCDDSEIEPRLWINSSDEVVQCLDPDGVELDIELQAPGADHTALALQGALLAEASTAHISLDRAGHHRFTGLAIEGSCGIETASSAWIAPPDGTPAGPISLALTPSTLEVAQDTAVLLSGPLVDCEGSPATAGDVELWTDRGSLTELMSSGTGLYARVTEGAEISVELDLTGALTGGLGSIYARVDHGGAAGRVLFSATGDERPPRVARQAPEGAATGLVDQIDLWFDEPLDLASITLDAFEIDGPVPVVVHDVEILSPQHLAVHLSSAVNASLGVYTLRIFDTLTDLAGNPLDTGESSLSSAYESVFGATSDMPPTSTSCTLAHPVFRPNGDPGSGVEADEAVVSFAADIEHGTFRFAVRDDSGAVLRTERQEVRGGGEGSFAWDGRDQSEAIAPDGRYTLVITPHTIAGTPGPSCEVQVDLAIGWGPQESP